MAESVNIHGENFFANTMFMSRDVQNGPANADTGEDCIECFHLLILLDHRIHRDREGFAPFPEKFSSWLEFLLSWDKPEKFQEKRGIKSELLMH